MTHRSDGTMLRSRIAALELEATRLRNLVITLEDELLVMAAKLSAAESVLTRMGVLCHWPDGCSPGSD